MAKSCVKKSHFKTPGCKLSDANLFFLALAKVLTVRICTFAFAYACLYTYCAKFCTVLHTHVGECKWKVLYVQLYILYIRVPWFAIQKNRSKRKFCESFACFRMHFVLLQILVWFSSTLLHFCLFCFETKISICIQGQQKSCLKTKENCNIHQRKCGSVEREALGCGKRNSQLWKEKLTRVEKGTHESGKRNSWEWKEERYRII